MCLFFEAGCGDKKLLVYFCRCLVWLVCVLKLHIEDGASSLILHYLSVISICRGGLIVVLEVEGA